MEKDSLESSHPVSIEVNDPGEISAMFDTISYNKGASIIRMMNAFLSESTFRKGVSNYLNIYKYANTIQENLFDELNKAAQLDKSLDSNLSVTYIMETW
jgi:aminopeptidase N